jgi:hypothetical protein
LAGTLNDPLSGDWFSNFLNESQNGSMKCSLKYKTILVINNFLYKKASSLFAQETVNSMRAKLLEELIKVIPLHYADSKGSFFIINIYICRCTFFTNIENIPIVKKSVIIRLYTALLGLSGFS